MSITARANAAMTDKALQEPSTSPDEAVVDPSTLTLIIDAVMRLASMLCTGAAPMQTAQAMKSPSPIQRWRHQRDCQDKAAEFVVDDDLEDLQDELEDGRPEGMGRKEWKAHRRQLRQQIRNRTRRLKQTQDDYARRAYEGMRKTAEAQPVEAIAEAVEGYRVEEGMVAA